MTLDQEKQFRSPIDQAFLFVQSVMMGKIARQARQAIFVDGIGLYRT
jgi:hypothetical protein